MQTTETPAETLARIQSGFSKNDVLAIMAFAGAGIDPDDVSPRENVLTFNAWKAKGRRVAKYATGVPVTVWIPKSKKDDDDEKGGNCYPKTTRLFHVSQTVEIDSKDECPAGWQNPALFKPEALEHYAVEELAVA